MHFLSVRCFTVIVSNYQELCRQRMAIRTSERADRPETLRNSRLNSVSSQFSDGPAASPSTRSSTSSWCEEPVPSNMDISTGHMILVSHLLYSRDNVSHVVGKGGREEVGWSVFYLFIVRSFRRSFVVLSIWLLQLNNHNVTGHRRCTRAVWDSNAFGEKTSGLDLCTIWTRGTCTQEVLLPWVTWIGDLINSI